MKTICSVLLRLALLGLPAVLLSSGCASYEVKVDSLARSTVRRSVHSRADLSSYKIRPGDPLVADDSLRFKEAARHIKTALSGHGMWEAPTAESAELVVEIAYNVTPGHVVYDEVQVPVFGPARSVPSSESGAFPAPEPQAGRPRELLGFEDRLRPVIVHEKQLSVSCRENRSATEGALPVELWCVTASIEDQSKDIRKYLPILASVVMEQMGKTTDGIATGQLDKDDPAIGFIARGL